MDDPTPAEIVHVALDDLLLVVERAAEDLRLFHATVSRARPDPLPPFPRASVVLTSRVIHHLQEVEHDLSHVLIALGLGRPPTT